MYVAGDRLELVPDGACREGHVADRRRAPDPAVRQLPGYPDGARVIGRQTVPAGQGEPGLPRLNRTRRRVAARRVTARRRVAGRAARGEPGLEVLHFRIIRIEASVRDHVRARAEDVPLRRAAVPAQHRHRGRVGGDQVERIVADQVGHRAERQFAAAHPDVGRGLLAPAVEHAGHPGHSGINGQPRPARLLVQPADQRLPRPVAAGWQPGPGDELVPDAEQQQRHRGGRVEADDDGAHGPTIT